MLVQYADATGPGAADRGAAQQVAGQPETVLRVPVPAGDGDPCAEGGLPGACGRPIAAHRTGNGLVFSSRFQSEEAARDSFLAAPGEAPITEPRLIRFQTGRRRQSWVGNVVAIGLSSGFLKPLESTSIHLIQSGIAKLLALFPRNAGDALVAEQFNRVFAQEMCDIRDFLILHYAMSQGRDDPMWGACQVMTLPDSLRYRVDQFRTSGRIMLSTDELFRDASWFAVLDGQGVVPRDYNPLADGLSAADNLAHLRAVSAAIDRAARSLPPLRP